MVLSKNYFGQLEIPQFILCKASKERIGIIKAVEKNYDRKFNDLDEISFTMYLDPLEHYKYTKNSKIKNTYSDDFDPEEYNKIYNALDVMKYIEVPSIGRFAISSVELSSEGTRNENKQVTAQSYECLLGQKYIENFIFNKGTIGSVEYTENVADEKAYPFYEEGTNKHLFYYILEKFPEWSVGHVDESLKGMIRSFEIDSKDVYSFLMEDVADAYQCYFVFDTLLLTINAYALEAQGQHDPKYDTNVHISYNNLLKSANVSCDIDDIKTCLKVEGDSDEMTLREINMGSDRIYNFDYYATPDYMSNSLIENYKKWQDAKNATIDLDKIEFKEGVLEESDLAGKNYNDAYTALLDKEYQLNLDYAKENSTKMPYETNQRYIGYGTFMLNDNEPTYNVLTVYEIKGNPRYSRTWLTLSKGSTDPLNPQKDIAYAVYDDMNSTYTGYKWDEETNMYKRLDVITFDSFTKAQMCDSKDNLPNPGDQKTLYIIGALNDNDLLPSRDYEMYRWDEKTYKYYNVNEWDNYALVPYQEKLKSAQRMLNVASKAGYGSPIPKTNYDVITDKASTKISDISAQSAMNLYLTQYVPVLYTIRMLERKISEQEDVVNNIGKNIDVINAAERQVASYVNINKWLTQDNLTELSAFIREDTISTDYFTLTDSMTEKERKEMLNGLKDYAATELQRVSTPELTFTADIVNLFALPEFDSVANDNANGIAPGLDIGNYLWVTLRDDYIINVKVTEMNFDLLDPSNFAITFSNIVRKQKDIFTQAQDAINDATAAATTVSFNQSNWSETSNVADSIHTALQDGLLSAGYYLRNAANSELVIDDRGMFIDTVSTTDSNSSMYGHGKGDANGYDSIYVGGGRILFTEDGWKTVSMSVGRGDVQIPDYDTLDNGNGEMKYVTQSRFGVFADYMIAGYMAGSTIVGGQLYSDNYKKGWKGSHINLEEGTMEFYSSDGENKTGYLTLDENGNLSLSGDVHASTGNIGNLILSNGSLYSSNKSQIDDDKNGIYIGADGIALGSNFKATSDGVVDIKATSFKLQGQDISELMNVGGVNLVRDSAKFPYFSPLGGYAGTRTVVEDSDARSGYHIEFKCTTAGTGWHCPVYSKKSSDIGKKFTWSFWAKCSVTKSGAIGHEGGGQADVTFTTEWQRFKHTWTMQDTQYTSFTFYEGWNVGETLYIRDFKIEEGAVATAWCANIEDDLEQSNLVNKITNSQDRNGIYLEGNTLCINATNIKAGTITGIEFNNGDGTFKVSPEGAITSTSGSIGGFTISQYNIKGTNVGMGCSSGHDYAFWAGANSGSNAIFRVGHDGVLEASKVKISGDITASSGTFNGTVNANGGTFSNWITCNGTISGGTISGSLIKQTISGANQGDFNPNVSGTSQLSNGVLTVGEIHMRGGGDIRASGADTNDSDRCGISIYDTLSCHGNFYTNRHGNHSGNAFIRGYCVCSDYRDGSKNTLEIGGESFSDEKLKKDIEPISIQQSKEFIMALKPIVYSKKNVESIWQDDGKKHHGFIAQDTEKCVYDNWGLITPQEAHPEYLTIKYTEIIADMVRVIQDQENRIKQLEEKKE